MCRIERCKQWLHSVEMCSILTTSEHQLQQECTECNHCVHLSILHIQMCAKSRSWSYSLMKVLHTLDIFYKGVQTPILVQYFDNVRAPIAARISECNIAYIFRFCSIQMCAKSRSNHTHSWKCCIHRNILQRCKNTNSCAVFWQRQSTNAARMHRV